LIYHCYFQSFSLSQLEPYHHLHAFPTRRSSDLFMEGIRPESIPAGNGHFTVNYPVRPGIFRHFCEQAQKLNGPCILIIDEINRRSEEHTSELQSREKLVCRLLLEKKKKNR